jgi:glycosyltransferase involved in cell wall biosynthesis
MEVSIIIPTYNEERYLPRLMKSLGKQSYLDFEIIVADAGSEDRTVDIAREGGASVVRGGRPARGRNAGAAEARGTYLFFLDADITVPKTFLRRTLSEMKKRSLDLATCESRPISNRRIDHVLFGFANLFIQMNQDRNPHALGYCILVKKGLFEKVGGFDESIEIGEDFDFVKRAAGISPLRVLKSAHVNVSVRRLDAEGRWRHVGKTIYTTLYRAVKGEIREDVVKYEFGGFSDERAAGDGRAAKALLRQLKRLRRDFEDWAKEMQNQTRKLTSGEIAGEPSARSPEEPAGEPFGERLSRLLDEVKARVAEVLNLEERDSRRSGH